MRAQRTANKPRCSYAYSSLGAPQHGYAYPIWSLAVYMQSARRGSLRMRDIRRCLLTSPSPPRQESAAAAVHDR